MQGARDRGDLVKCDRLQRPGLSIVAVDEHPLMDPRALITTRFVGRSRRSFLAIARNGTRAVEYVIVGRINHAIRQIGRPTVLLINIDSTPLFDGGAYLKGRLPRANCCSSFQFLISVQRVVIYILLLSPLATRLLPLLASGDPHNCDRFARLRDRFKWFRRCFFSSGGHPCLGIPFQAVFPLTSVSAGKPSFFPYLGGPSGQIPSFSVDAPFPSSFPHAGRPM